MEKPAMQPERTLWNRCNKRLVLESVVLIVILAVAPSHVFAQTFTIIDVPGALQTRVNGIGPNGQIVGDYENSGAGPPHGFVLDRGVFTTIDAPGTGQTPGNMTFAMAINARGQVVGWYIVNFLVRGFLFDHGVFTTIDASIYVPGAYGTRLNGINSGVRSLASTRILSVTTGSCWIMECSPPSILIHRGRLFKSRTP